MKRRERIVLNKEEVPEVVQRKQPERPDVQSRLRSNDIFVSLSIYR